MTNDGGKNFVKHKQNSSVGIDLIMFNRVMLKYPSIVSIVINYGGTRSFNKESLGKRVLFI